LDESWRLSWFCILQHKPFFLLFFPKTKKPKCLEAYDESYRSEASLDSIHGVPVGYLGGGLEALLRLFDTRRWNVYVYQELPSIVPFFSVLPFSFFFPLPPFNVGP
jgi:hypothetical protein